MQHARAVAAPCYLSDVCKRAAIRNMRLLLRIYGSYLWPVSLPKEPMVRRGLEGLTHVGSGVLCASVFTSGSISEGEGVSLAPAMALCLPSGTSSRERAICFLLVWQQLRDRHCRKTASPFHCCFKKAEGEQLSPCCITGSCQTLWGKHLADSCWSSAPPSLMEMWGPVSEIHASSPCNVNRTAKPTQMGYITKMVKWSTIPLDLINVQMIRLPSVHRLWYLSKLIFLINKSVWKMELCQAVLTMEKSSWINSFLCYGFKYVPG